MWAFQMAGPGTLERVTSPEPEAADLTVGDAVVAFDVGGLCGSDYPEFRDRLLSDVTDAGERRPPLHEVVGTVVRTRSDLLPIGTRLVAWAKDYHGLCEFVVVSDRQAARVPASMGSQTAVIAQPLACVLFAADRLGDVSGKHVAVLGLGPIGLLFCHVLSRRGAHVTGVDRLDRARLALAMGATRVVHSGANSWARALPDRDRPDLIVEAVGHQQGTVNDAILAVRPGGTVLAFGINDDPYYSLNMHALIRKRLTVMAGIADDHAQQLGRALEELDRHPGTAETLVTDVFPVEQAQTAYQAALDPSAARGKVLISAVHRG